MSSLNTALAIGVLLGSAMNAGLFFAFSNFIMKALSRLSVSAGVATMQSINVVVLNPLFFGLFIGTTVASAILVVLAIVSGSDPASLYWLGGGALFFVGTFLVTGLGNVPLNNHLAAVTTEDEAAHDIWQHYLTHWTRLNTVRTVFATLAAIVVLLGLMQ